MELVNPSSAAPYMVEAAWFADKSNCQKLKFGAVLVLDDQVIGRGYNKSMVPELCCMRQGVTSGTRYEICGSIHAEQMSMMKGLAHPDALGDIRGSTIYLYGWLPSTKAEWRGDVMYCTLCSRFMSYLGVKGMVMRATDGDLKFHSTKEMLAESYEYARRQK